MNRGLMKQSWSALQGVPLPEGSPAFPDLILNRDQRGRAGVGLAYADEYNQMQMNQYNNAYNYWLWQQQMAYNSPAAQVARLKEAGLNPNFNSIDGTGNVSQIPSSSGSARGNVSSNTLQAISTGVNIATGLATAVSRGIGALKNVASIPSSVRAYRKLLYGIMENRLTGSSLKNAMDELHLEQEGVLAGNYPGSYAPSIMDSLWYRGKSAAVEGAELANQFKGKEMAILDLRRQLAEFDLYHLSPLKERELTARIPLIKAQMNFILQGTGLRMKENSWKNPKEGVDMAAKILDAIIPF